MNVINYEKSVGLEELCEKINKSLAEINSEERRKKILSLIEEDTKGMASTNRIIPARISDAVTEEVKDLAKKVFSALNLSGVCRIDFLIDKKNEKVYVNEPNTIPGSLSFYLWQPTGKEYKTLLDDVITIAIKDYKKKSKKICSFDNNLLQNFGGLKGVKGLKGLKGLKR